MVEGLHCIMITDRDGATILQAAATNNQSTSVQPKFLASLGTAIEQARKLGLGSNKSMLVSYKTHQFVCWNHSPLIVTLMADADANTGLLMGLQTDLKPVIHELTTAVKLAFPNN